MMVVTTRTFWEAVSRIFLESLECGVALKTKKTMMMLRALWNHQTKWARTLGDGRSGSKRTAASVAVAR
jgi:hypothetical protein